MNKPTPYQAVFTITLDRPELRDDSFPKVAAGTKTCSTWYFRTQGAALKFRDDVLAGRWDYLSEYVSSIAVYRKHEKRVTVRRFETRSRPETEHERMLRTLAVGAKRRGALHTVFSTVYV